MSRYTDSSINWNVFSKERNCIYGVAIISIMIFHFFEDVLSSELAGGLHYVARVYNTFIGSVGVEWFVFLSGMGLYFSLKKEANMHNYFPKRIKRVLPAYILIASTYWFLVDVVISKVGIASFLKDFFFVTFLTHGTRTFWYVLFILAAYIVYPIVYRLLNSRFTENFQLVILIIAALLLQLLPRLFIPWLYLNIEILLCRFLAFFIGCWCGKKVYRMDYVNSKDLIGLCFGALLMLCSFTPLTKTIVYKAGYRFLMCFWGVFLLFLLVILSGKLPNRVRSFLEYSGKMSYELYLTHVTVRAFMNIVGMRTCYLQNYFLCIVISIIFTLLITLKQRRNNHAV